MARSLTSQRRHAETYADVFDNNNLLSPILSESEPEDDEDCPSTATKPDSSTAKTRLLTKCSEKLKVQQGFKLSAGFRDDVDLSDFEREERRCNTECSESDDSDNAAGRRPSSARDTPTKHLSQTARTKLHHNAAALDDHSDSDDHDLVLSELEEWDRDSLSEKPEHVSPDITVEIVDSPRQKSLREVIDTVDEAFALDIKSEHVIEQFSFPVQNSNPEDQPHTSGQPKRSRLPTPKKHGSSGQSHHLVDNHTSVRDTDNGTHRQDVRTVKPKLSCKSRHSNPSITLSYSDPDDSLTMSNPLGLDDDFDPFAPLSMPEDIFEPKPKFEIIDDSFKTREPPAFPTDDTEKHKDDDDYCDSLDGDAAEDIHEVQPPDDLFEDELKAEANALAISIAKLSENPDEHKEKMEERAGTPDSLEPDLEALDDAATLQKKVPGAPRCAAVKKKDIEAIRKKIENFPTFKARPSPFKKKKSEKSKESDIAENPDSTDENQEKLENAEKPAKDADKVEKPPQKPTPSPPQPKVPIPKPKGRPPLPPASPRPPFKKALSVGSVSSNSRTSTSPSVDKQHSAASNHNGMAKLTSPTDSETADDVFKDGDDPLAAVLQSKVAEGLIANLLEFGGEHPKDRTRRSSASGDSVTSAGAESSATGVASLAAPGKKIVETKSSVKRRQAIIAKRTAPVMEEESDDYLTPSQRKDKMLKDLKKELKNIQVSLAGKEVEMHDLLLNKEGESWERLKSKEEESSSLRKDLVETKDLLSDMETKLTQMSEKLEKRNKKIRELEGEMERREHANQEMYLKMYEKGQQSAMFERQDQLEKMAEEDLDSVSPSELLHKLEVTQKELIRWQALKRQESYDDAARPETPAEAKLNFLKDSMYHYLTDRETEALHLRAMVGLLGFTEVQIRKIKNASKEHKGRRSSAK